MSDAQTLTLDPWRVTLLVVGLSRLRMAEVMDVPEAVWRRQAPWFDAPVVSPVQSVLLRHPEITVLVDACAAMPPGSPYAIPDAPPGPDLLAQLAAMGVQPGTVDHVVITHAHFDHLNAALRPDDTAAFPNARYHVGRADTEDAAIAQHLEEAFGAPHPLQRLDEQGRLDRHDGPWAIAPGIDVLPAPGESPGHQIVRLTSGDRTFYALGDLFHHPIEVERPEWCTWWGDAEAMRASRRALFQRAAKEQAVLVASHIEGFGRLARRGEGFVWKPVPA